MKIRISGWRHHLPVGVMLALAVASFPKALPGQAVRQFPRQDFEARTDIYTAHPVSKSTNLLLGAGLHFSRDQGNLVYRKISTGLAFHWWKFLILEPYYQYSVRDSADGSLSHENRLAFATTVGAPWKRWYVSDRNLGERRFQDTRRSWRYRNRLEFRRPIRLERRRLSVFVWDEVYYSSIVHKWYRNRAAVGAGRRLSRRVSVEIYYLHQNDGYSRPGDLNGIEMNISTVF
ncbi:MAG: DUF2490 domain-containing protein [Acidobacteriota bacterium]